MHPGIRAVSPSSSTLRKATGIWWATIRPSSSSVTPSSSPTSFTRKRGQFLAQFSNRNRSYLLLLLRICKEPSDALEGPGHVLGLYHAAAGDDAPGVVPILGQGHSGRLPLHERLRVAHFQAGQSERRRRLLQIPLQGTHHYNLKCQSTRSPNS